MEKAVCNLLYEAAENLFTDFEQLTGPLPTAVFAFNDRLATGAVNAIRKSSHFMIRKISV